VDGQAAAVADLLPAHAIPTRDVAHGDVTGGAQLAADVQLSARAVVVDERREHAAVDARQIEAACPIDALRSGGRSE
jgi:hypothetical protein